MFFTGNQKDFCRRLTSAWLSIVDTSNIIEASNITGAQAHYLNFQDYRGA